MRSVTLNLSVAGDSKPELEERVRVSVLRFVGGLDDGYDPEGEEDGDGYEEEEDEVDYSYDMVVRESGDVLSENLYEAEVTVRIKNV